MAVDNDYQMYIEKQLECFGEFNTKKMFGGVGYFRENIMFGVIMHGAFRLKGDKTTADDFAKYGIEMHQIPGKKMKMPYYEVPQEILSNTGLLKEWTTKVWEVAIKSKKR